MKKTLHVIAFGSLALATGAQADEKNVSSLQGKGLNIGFVDTFEVMRNCKSGQEATKDLTAQRERLAKELQDEEQLVVKAMSDFRTKSATPAFSDSARETEEKRIMNMRRGLESKAQQFEDDLKISMQKVSERIAKEVDDAVVAMGKSGGYDAMVDKMTGRVIYAKAELDVTEMVTKQVDNKKGGSANKAAPVSVSKVTQSSVPAKKTA